MNIRVLFLLALLLGVSFNVSAKKKEEAPVNGLVYKLPRTVVKINLQSEYQVYKTGPYAKYAESMLGIKGVPMQDMHEWEIKSISFDNFSEADPNQQYQSLGIGGTLVSLYSNGVIAGVNTKAEQISNSQGYTSFVAPNLDIPETNFSELTMDGRYYTVTDSLGSHRIAKTDEEMAMDAANTIIDLRQQRYDLLTSVLDSSEPTDAATLKAAAERIENLEKKYISLFIGVNYKQTVENSFYVVPTPDMQDGYVAFRFSKDLGPLPTNDFSGMPVQLSIESQTTGGQTAGVSSSPSALYYRIPGKAKISLRYDNKTIASTNLELAQFGNILPVPENLLDGRYEIVIDPNTGSIASTKQIIFEEINSKRKK